LAKTNQICYLSIFCSELQTRAKSLGNDVSSIEMSKRYRFVEEILDAFPSAVCQLIHSFCGFEGIKLCAFEAPINQRPFFRIVDEHHFLVFSANTMELHLWNTTSKTIVRKANLGFRLISSIFLNSELLLCFGYHPKHVVFDIVKWEIAHYVADLFASIAIGDVHGRAINNRFLLVNLQQKETFVYEWKGNDNFECVHRFQPGQYGLGWAYQDPVTMVVDPLDLSWSLQITQLQTLVRSVIVLGDFRSNVLNVAVSHGIMTINVDLRQLYVLVDGNVQRMLPIGVWNGICGVLPSASVDLLPDQRMILHCLDGVSRIFNGSDVENEMLFSSPVVSSGFFPSGNLLCATKREFSIWS
jgi:hypothetical protein